MCACHIYLQLHLGDTGYAHVSFTGIGGRLGVGSSLGAYVRKITAMEKPENLDDPREAVLKYAKVCTYVRMYTIPQCHAFLYT